VVYHFRFSTMAQRRRIQALPGTLHAHGVGLKKEPPPVYKGQFAPQVLLGAFMVLHEITG
jgi:hypothetical protein